MKTKGFIGACCLAATVFASGIVSANSSNAVSLRASKSSLSSPSSYSYSSKQISSASQSSKNNKSVKSSSSIPGCAYVTGGVFIDSICSPWRNPSIFEMNSVTFASREITDTNIGEGLSYSIVDTGDAAHHQVLDIHYANQTIVNGVVHIFAPVSATNSVDLSEYATGKLIFDINVINEGTAKPDIEFNIECGWPCGSTPLIIRPVALNQWQTVEVSVAEMIKRGLDITKVATGFMILPTWGKQANAHYQIDNIRWVKGRVVKPKKTVCYANYLDSPWIAGVQGNGAISLTSDSHVDQFKIRTLTTSINPFATLSLDWSSIRGRWTYSLSEAMSYSTGQLLEPSTLSACSGDGVLSLEVYVPKSYVDDGKLKFSLHFMDKNHNVYEIPHSKYSIARFKADSWNKISVKLSALTKHDDLMYVGLSFDSTFINPAIKDVLKIDNIVITQKIESSSSSSTSSFVSSKSNSSIKRTSSASKTSSASISSVYISSSKSSVKSSSYRSTASSSVATSPVIIQDVFTDQLDPTWKELSAWETTKDRSFSAEYSDGTQAQLVHWAVVPSADQGHGNVIDVQFTDNTNYNGLFHITAIASSGVNLSEFATGKLVFDIKLLNAGNLSPALSVMADCGYPCTSHAFPLTIPNTNQWVTQEIAIADLIYGGLDISKVNTVFQILPSWDKQTGVNFQLDNIRWEKGSTTAPVIPASCYKQPFETWGLAFHFDWLNGSPAVISNALTQIIAQTNITPNWSSSVDKFGYAPVVDNTFSACAFANATLSAQIYLAKSYVDDGNMQLGFYYEDSNQRRAYFAPVSAAALKANDWTTISTNLSPYNGFAPFVSVDSAFDTNSITNIGIYFDANGKSTNVIGEISVDNIAIIEK